VNRSTSIIVSYGPATATTLATLQVTVHAGQLRSEEEITAFHALLDAVMALKDVVIRRNFPQTL